MVMQILEKRNAVEMYAPPIVQAALDVQLALMVVEIVIIVIIVIVIVLNATATVITALVNATRMTNGYTCSI